MSKEIRRMFNRQNQKITQMIDKTKRSTVLDDLADIEQRITLMVRTVDEITHKLYDCLRTRNIVVRDGELKDREQGKNNKKMHKLKEFQLQQTVQEKVIELRRSPDIDLLTNVLECYQSSVDVLWAEQQRAEEDILSKIVAPVRAYAEELKHIMEKKDRLKRFVLDMDIAKNRYLTAEKACESADKLSPLQFEVDTTTSRVDQAKEDLLADMYTLAAKEIDIASTYSVLIQIQLDYHRTVMQSLEQTLPQVQRKIATYAHRPVFGCALDDHLRYTGRTIALVLEVCAAAICEIGQEEDGIFRQSGNNARIRKLRAAFDSGDIVRMGGVDDGQGGRMCTPLDDCQRDPHALASVLKSYLRDLPDTLTTHEMYNEWIAIAHMESSDRPARIAQLLTQMPSTNYANLRYLMLFFAHLATFEPQTRMSPKNFALVIAPNILADSRSESSSMMGAVVVQTMIVHAHELFPGDVQFTSEYIKPLIDSTGGFNTMQSRTASDVSEGVVVQPSFTPPPLPQSVKQSRPKSKAPPPPPGHSRGDGAEGREMSTSSDSMYDNDALPSMTQSMNDAMITASHTLPHAPPPDRPPPPPTHRKMSSYDPSLVDVTSNNNSVDTSQVSVVSIDVNASTGDRPFSYIQSMTSPVAAPRRPPPGDLLMGEGEEEGAQVSPPRPDRPRVMPPLPVSSTDDDRPPTLPTKPRFNDVTKL